MTIYHRKGDLTICRRDNLFLLYFPGYNKCLVYDKWIVFTQSIILTQFQLWYTILRVTFLLFRLINIEMYLLATK